MAGETVVNGQEHLSFFGKLWKTSEKGSPKLQKV